MLVLFLIQFGSENFLYRQIIVLLATLFAILMPIFQGCRIACVLLPPTGLPLLSPTLKSLNLSYTQSRATFKLKNFRRKILHIGFLHFPRGFQVGKTDLNNLNQLKLSQGSARKLSDSLSFVSDQRIKFPSKLFFVTCNLNKILI